jgi:hypothetical protein
MTVDAESDLNMRMVAAGVRSGWMTSDWTVEYTESLLKRMQLDTHLAVHAIDIRGKVPMQGVLVVQRRPHPSTAASSAAARPLHRPKLQSRSGASTTAAYPGTLRSHEAVATALGIPCGSRTAWHDPSLCHAFIVWASPPTKVKCKAQHYDDGAITITSFWCASRADGMRWCRAFIRRAAAFVDARGMELHFQTTSTIQ